MTAASVDFLHDGVPDGFARRLPERVQAQRLFTFLLLAACLLVSLDCVRLRPGSHDQRDGHPDGPRLDSRKTVILAKMRSSQTKFDTRTEALIALKQPGRPRRSCRRSSAAARRRRRPRRRLGARGLGGAAAAPRRASGPIYHLSAGKQVELIGTSGDVETSRAAPSAAARPSSLLAGNKAKYRTTDRQPVFLTTGDPADVVLVKRRPGKNDRNLRISARPTSAVRAR